MVSEDREGSRDASVVREKNIMFGSDTLIESETRGVTEEACEQLLLDSPTAVAYTYHVLLESCVLHSGMTNVAIAASINAGAKMQEFPWLCNLYCKNAGDSRWTSGVVTVGRTQQHTCQCCFNEAASSSSSSPYAHYLCSSEGCQLCAGDVTAPSTTSTTTTVTPTSTNCGCSSQSIPMVSEDREGSRDASVVRESNIMFGSDTLIESETRGVTEEACEQLLLDSPTAVAYTYHVLLESCVLHSGMTNVSIAASINAGAKMQEFPWLCNIYCKNAGDSRWTSGVVKVGRTQQHTCQCCFNEAASSSSSSPYAHYLCSSEGCQLCAGDVTAPSTTSTTTTVTPTSTNCGCSSQSIPMVSEDREGSRDASVVRESNIMFGSDTLIESETRGVTEEACEQLLLDSPTAVAYTYHVLLESCVLHSGMTNVAIAASINAGAKMQEFPWLCNLYCKNAGDSRWTSGVVKVGRTQQHTCQCCFNEEASSSSSSPYAHYLCSSEGCQVCAGDETALSTSPQAIDASTNSMTTTICQVLQPLGLYWLLAFG